MSKDTHQLAIVRSAISPLRKPANRPENWKPNRFRSEPVEPEEEKKTLFLVIDVSIFVWFLFLDFIIILLDVVD